MSTVDDVTRDHSICPGCLLLPYEIYFFLLCKLIDWSTKRLSDRLTEEVVAVFLTYTFVLGKYDYDSLRLGHGRHVFTHIAGCPFIT